MSRFGVPEQPAPAFVVDGRPVVEKPGKPARQGRAGKILVHGHLSAELNRAVKVLATDQGTTTRTLIGGAGGDPLSKYGKHPSGKQ